MSSPFASVSIFYAAKYAYWDGAPLPCYARQTDFMSRLFTGRSAEACLDLTLSVSQSVTKTQMSHLETSNADSAQSKDVWNENLEFSMSSADCLLSADCLQNQNEPFRDF